MISPTTVKTFDIGVADGIFQPVVVPIYCKSFMIQIGTGIITDFTSFQETPLVFHYSTSGNETEKDFTQHVNGVVISIDTPAGSIVGYVRAVAGAQLSGVVLS